MAQLRQMAQEMADVQRQMAEAPGAGRREPPRWASTSWPIHLRQQPPNPREVSRMIAVFGSLLESARAGRAPTSRTLFQALDQLRMAFVQLFAGAGDGDPGAKPTAS